MFSPEGNRDAEGPNASLAYGGVAANNALAQSLRNSAPGAYAASVAPPGAPAQPAGPGPQMTNTGPTPQTVQGPPTFQDQGVPRTPDGRLDTNKTFSDLSVVPAWRQQARVWAAHPQAGHYLKMLGRMADL